MPGSYSFSAEIIGGDELRKALTQAADQAPKMLADALNRTAYVIQPAAVQAAPGDTGQLKGSIHTEPATAETLEAKVGTNVKHAWPMETGSRPHYVSPAVLKPWARRKFGNESIAYAVAKSIARKGVKGRKYMIDTFKDKKDLFNDNMRKALNSIFDIIRR